MKNEPSDTRKAMALHVSNEIVSEYAKLIADNISKCIAPDPGKDSIRTLIVQMSKTQSILNSVSTGLLGCVNMAVSAAMNNDLTIDCKQAIVDGEREVIDLEKRLAAALKHNQAPVTGGN